MRVSLRNTVAALGVAALGLLAVPKPASALVIEMDDQGLSGGVITQAGTTITGTGILFDIITLESNIGGSVLKTAQCGLTDTLGTTCEMNFSFDTSTNTGTISVTTLGGLFDSGPDGAAFSGDESAASLFLAPGSTVLSGTLSSAGFIGGTIFGAEGNDQKAQEVLDFFNIVVSGDFDLSTTEIKTVAGNVTDSDLVNNGNFRQVPEPGVLTLFGLGLLGVGRKFRRSN